MTDALSLRTRLFGSLELLLTDQPAPPGFGKIRQQAAADSPSCAPSSPTAQSALAYLIVHHERAVPREKLVGLFWPDRPSSRARHALSHAIWQIRASLGPAADRLITDRDAVTFATQADDWIDVEEFEATLREATRETSALLTSHPASLLHSLTSSVELYRGDFLDAIYDDWVLVERERLREIYLRAMERLTTLHKQLGDYEQALICAQRLIHADPLRERGHREVMRLYHLLGRSRAALQQFDSLRCLLNEELGVEPSAASVALHHEITLTLEEAGLIHLPLPPAPPPLLRNLGHLPFVGRTRERAALVDALQAAVQDHGGVVLIEGDPGVGKTRLVQEIIAMGRWRGFQIALGKAESSPASAPYQPLRDALSSTSTPLRVAQLTELIEPLWLSAAAHILPAIAEQVPDLPPLPTLDPQKEQRRLREGVSRCLRGLASFAPLLLVLEDLHWADEATLSGIPHLVGRLSSSRMLTVLTYRPAESHERNVLWATLDALDRVLPVQRVRLSPFERSEAVALILRALGVGPTDRQASAFAQRLNGEIGGNALFLVETLRSLLEKGNLAPISSSASTGWTFPAENWPIPTPTSIRQLVGTRVTRLPSELHCALELVAVLGEHADVPALVDATDTSSVELLAALGELQRRGFLRETERQYRFRHDSVREIVYQSISRERRQELHRQVGTTLERLHPDQIEILGYHFSRGQVWQADRNLISGNNEYGIDVSGGCTHIVRNNYIGVNWFGDTEVPNAMSGIRLGGGATYAVIADNLISGNKAHGLILTGPDTAHNTTTGNRIGTGATGRYPVANLQSGVLISAGAHDNSVSNSVVGGNENGIELSGPVTHDNIIRGNIVGLGKDGIQPVANWFVGILVSNSYSNTIDGNVVTGNGSHGIHLQGSATAHNRVSGSDVGTRRGGQQANGNVGDGIRVSLGAHNNTIGPTNCVEHNFGNGVGVYTYTTDYNTTTRNSIADNNGAGIHVVEGNDSILPPTISSNTSPSSSQSEKSSTVALGRALPLTR